jgi:hypothetical protein
LRIPSPWGKTFKTAIIIENALISLGESAYTLLFEEDKQLLDFYI